MRLATLLTATMVIAASPALADGYGTFAPNKPKTGWPGATPAPQPKFAPLPAPAPRAPAPTRPMTLDPPKAATPPAFKPIEPWKPKASTTSMFGPDGKPKR